MHWNRRFLETMVENISLMNEIVVYSETMYIRYPQKIRLQLFHSSYFIYGAGFSSKHSFAPKNVVFFLTISYLWKSAFLGWFEFHVSPSYFKILTFRRVLQSLVQQEWITLAYYTSALLPVWHLKLRRIVRCYFPTRFNNPIEIERDTESANYRIHITTIHRCRPYENMWEALNRTYRDPLCFGPLASCRQCTEKYHVRKDTLCPAVIFMRQVAYKGILDWSLTPYFSAWTDRLDRF